MRQLSPFLTSHLGFNRLFDELDSLLEKGFQAPSYPPFNVAQDDAGVQVEVALAGFKKDDISISHDRQAQMLTISSNKSDEETARTYVRRGIGRRAFTLSFRVANDLEVRDAAFEDGILTVDLKKIVRDEDKPLLIPIK